MLPTEKAERIMAPNRSAPKRSAPDHSSTDDGERAKRFAWSSTQDQTSKLVAPFTDMAGNTIVSASSVPADKENNACQISTIPSTVATVPATSTGSSVVISSSASITVSKPQFKTKDKQDSLPPLVPAATIESSSSSVLTSNAGSTASLPTLLQMPQHDFDDESEEEIIGDLANRFDCDAMRRKIQRFLAGKTVTQTAFLKEMGVNSNSFRRFMQLKGPFSGNQNGTYWGALKYFHRQENQQKQTAPQSTATTKEAKQRAKADANDLLGKVGSVYLPNPVYVFDDCDEIRKKINEVIASKRLTQAALLRELEVNSNSLRRFLSSKGKREGCSNGVYLKAYCFFEKLRIAEGRPKTKKRLTKEAELPQGYPLKRDPTHFVVSSRVPFDGRALRKSLDEGTYWYRVAEAMNKSTQE